MNSTKVARSLLSEKFTWRVPIPGGLIALCSVVFELMLACYKLLLTQCQLNTDASLAYI